MKTTHKQQCSDLTWAVISFALIFQLFAFGQRYVNHQKSKYIQQVSVDGQGR